MEDARQAGVHRGDVASAVVGARELLRLAGVRYTLSRVKTLEALWMVCLAGGLHQSGVASSSLHQVLLDGGEPLSLASVRQVLRRMSEKGLIEPRGRGRFRFSPHGMVLMAAKGDT